MLFKKIIKMIVWLCLGFAIVVLCLFISLPAIVESQIVKRLPQFLNPNDIEFDIQKLGFYNTFVSKIRVTKGISIDSVNIDYDIKELSSIHLSKVTISGLSIHASLDENNQIRIQGLEFPRLSKDHTGQSGLSDLPGLFFLPEKIVLQNSKIILHALDDEFLIPFDVLSTISFKEGKIVARTLLYPFGEKINTLVTYDLNKGIESIKVEGKSFDLGHMDQFILKVSHGIQLKGPIDFTLESSSPQKKWEINVSQVGFTQPVEAAIKDLSTILLIDNQKISANGTFGISHSLLPATRMEYGLTLNLKNSLKNDYHFDLKFKNSKIQRYKIAYESNMATIKKPQLNAHFSGTPLKSKGKITLRLKEGLIQHQKEAFLFKDTKITSDMVLDFTDTGKGLNSKWALTTNNLSIKSDLMDSSFPLAGASGWFHIDKNNTPSLGMTLKALDGEIKSTEFKTKANGINIEIPISYPNVGKKVYGKYSIPTLSYNNQYSLSTKGKILQTDSKEFQVSGGVSFSTLPTLKVQFKSMVGFEKGLFASLDFKTNSVKLNDADIVKLMGQKIQNAEIDVTVSAKGKAELLNHQLETFMQVNVRDGNISIPDMNLIATGINTKVDFNDLLVLESVPGQILTIDLIEVNKIKINDARILFSIEDARSLLVENIRFNWCNGLVSTESIRIPQENNMYSLNLYCDRLELVQLLKQMGAFHAEGTGTLNGRIPVIYSDGNISFDNGFLFSTPGSGGKVVIDNADLITAGIPMDNPQFAQLDLAQEALKDFEYKWAKLVFHTFEDTLYVNMELDGKPGKLLPFEYKKEFGGFVRVDASSPGSRFQGIKLDVNLKLPFNEVMKFGNKIKSIFN
ncbi:MAG: YdbH domain-containing protein [Desulfobacula sp.]|uniref:intermembrane phospholipid transport protein YdbH family protein n=1 Tax=Desulfobacula sp. TaxID=2593537 RepID=UPI0025B89E64|nr:YdbH domain-containing protein [Desulfobacula sp.]MCD4722358.1 YdbH domain-containing protein [Desulfobacula sp.]